MILLTLVTAYADGTQKTIFSGQVKDKTSLKVEGYDLSLVTAQDKASLSYAGHNFIVREGACDNDEIFTLCMSELKSEFYAVITLYSNVADMKIEKKLQAEVPDFGVGDIVTVLVTVTNQGTLPASFNLADDTTGFEVLDTNSDCKKSGTIVIMNSSLRTQTSITCSYRMRAKTEGESILTAKMTYFDGFTTQQASTNLRFTVRKNEVLLNLEGDKPTYELSDRGELRITVKNALKDKIHIDKLEIDYPGLYKTDYDILFSQGQDSLALTDELEKDAEKIYKAAFNITKISHELTVILTYTGPGQVNTITKRYKFEVTKTSPTILLERLDKKVKVHIDNPTRTPLFNVDITVKSNYENVNIKRQLDYLLPFEKRAVEINLDSIPIGGAKYPIFVQIYYKTPYGEKLEYSRTLLLNFATKQQVLEKGAQTAGTNSTITVIPEKKFIITKKMKIAAIIAGSVVLLALLIFLGIIIFKKAKMKMQFNKKMKEVTIEQKPIVEKTEFDNKLEKVELEENTDVKKKNNKEKTQ